MPSQKMFLLITGEQSRIEMFGLEGNPLALARL